MGADPFKIAFWHSRELPFFQLLFEFVGLLALFVLMVVFSLKPGSSPYLLKRPFAEFFPGVELSTMNYSR